ncbi:MAG TPA: hypothetical protein VFS39_17940 [Nitrospira sp.]|nr:hypothetical protein [Nitrospira sp.]
MRTVSVNVLAIIGLVGLLAGGCASDEMKGSSSPSSMGSTSRSETTTGAVNSSSGSAMAGSSAGSGKNIDRIASGAAEDTLNDCLARIPKDASSGQRMLAEQSCHRDQARR